MNCIFISPNYPAGHWHYCAALRDAGCNVLGIGDAGYESFPYELRGNLSDYIRIGDIHNYDEVYRACASLIGKWGRVDRIETLNPYWSTLVDALRAEFCGRAGRPDDYYALKMSLRDEECGLPESIKNVSAKKAVEFAQQAGFPVLCVPLCDKTLGVHTVESEAELKKLFSKNGKDAFAVFAQHKGEPVSLDGYIRDGRVVVCTAQLIVGKGIMYSLDVTEGLTARAAECVSTLLPGDGFFHIDAVRLTGAVKGVGKKGDIVFNNISEAPGHEYIMDCMNAIYGCDVRSLWAAGKLGEDELEPKLCAAVVSRSFERSYKNSHEKVLRRLNIKLVKHGLTAEPDKGEFGEYVYIFTGENQAELRRYIKFITEDFA
ncbi:MAG: hypothetical protein E7546_07790 [Ruminococcaceae bacterium]|nr:hypothetical protein [Oscillospiraceae bacterium]